MMADDINDHVKLHEDLLLEIFLRSSVECLLRAKSVCKKWYNLIESTSFKHNHLRYQKNKNKVQLLLQYFQEDTQRLSFIVLDDESLESNIYHNVDNIESDFYHINLDGPIDGLYCLFNGRDRIALWNPSLVEFETLPLPHPHFFPHIDVYEGYTGFGVDSSTQSYKVVLVRTLDGSHDLYRRGHITVYNFTTNAWKFLHLVDDYLLYYQFFESQGISFLNGSCYWWTNSDRMVAFDMAEETFRRVLGPDLSHSNSSSGFITIHNNKVSLLCHCAYSTEIWVMLEEGVWIKQFSITSLPRIFCEVGLWKNDWILVAMDGFETDDIDHNYKLVLCHANSQEMTVVGPKGMPYCFRAPVYYESLVSVNCGTKYKRKGTSLSTISGFFLPYSNPYLDMNPKDDFSVK